jgi:hypothetical protein
MVSNLLFEYQSLIIAMQFQILRCDVIVDSIASLSIVTRTREIFIEEAPEVFEVRAFDSFGKDYIHVVEEEIIY